MKGREGGDGRNGEDRECVCVCVRMHVSVALK